MLYIDDPAVIPKW